MPELPGLTRGQEELLYRAEANAVGNIIADLLDTEKAHVGYPNLMLTDDERSWFVEQHTAYCLPGLGITDPIEEGYPLYVDYGGEKKQGEYYLWVLARLDAYGA